MLCLYFSCDKVVEELWKSCASCNRPFVNMVKQFALHFFAFLKVTRSRQLQRTPAAETDNEMLIADVACLNYTIVVEAIQPMLASVTWVFHVILPSYQTNVSGYGLFNLLIQKLAFVTVHNAILITALVNSSLFIPLT